MARPLTPTQRLVLTNVDRLRRRFGADGYCYWLTVAGRGPWTEPVRATTIDVLFERDLIRHAGESGIESVFDLTDAGRKVLAQKGKG